MKNLLFRGVVEQLLNGSIYPVLYRDGENQTASSFLLGIYRIYYVYKYLYNYVSYCEVKTGRSMRESGWRVKAWCSRHEGSKAKS